MKYQPPQDSIYLTPKPFDDQPREGKLHKGNRRTGAVKGMHSGTRRGQLPWKKDPLIRERVDLVWDLWAQGYSNDQMMAPVNELMRQRGVPEISIYTIQGDRKRIEQLVEEGTQDVRTEHIEALKFLKRKGWEEFKASEPGSKNKPALLSTLRATEETMAKIDGSLAPLKTEQIVSVTSQHHARMLIEVLVEQLGSTDAAENILQEVQKRLTGGSDEVVDTA